MALRHRSRRLRDKALEGDIVIHLKGGGFEVFDRDELLVLFIENMDKAFEDPQTPNCALREALLKATPESFREFEENFRPLACTHGIVRYDKSVTLYHVLQDGTVETEELEAGSEEAERELSLMKQGPDPVRS